MRRGPRAAGLAIGLLAAGCASARSIADGGPGATSTIGATTTTRTPATTTTTATTTTATTTTAATTTEAPVMTEPAATVPPAPATTTTETTGEPTPPDTDPSAPPSPAGPAPSVGDCAIFPADNPWNQRVDGLALNAASATWVGALGAAKQLHPDFGGPYGIPFIVVPPDQPATAINFTAYGDESDPGPYPVPLDAPVEGAPDPDGDRHVLAVQTGSCVLFELYRAFPQGDHWDADSGAVFDLKSNALRPDGWTSADAAGLPILPGLVRYEDVASGSIDHAIRFTARCTQRGYIHPATHQAGGSDTNCPPMGARFRMRADYDLSGLTGQSRVIAEAMKTYGMIVADNGSDWFFTGSLDPRWDVDDLAQLKSIPGSAFEVVDTGPIQH